MPNLYKVAVDYGHGITTGGKRSPDGSLREYKFNREVGMYFREFMLADSRFDLLEIVTDDSDLSISLLDENKYNLRSSKAIKWGADVFVSIHANASGDGISWTAPQGWLVYIQTKDGISQRLANCMKNNVPKEIDLNNDGISDIENDGIFIGNLAVNRDCERAGIPSVLLENGFFTNQQEIERMKTEEFKKDVARGIYNALKEYFGLGGQTTMAIVVANASVGAKLIVTKERNDTAQYGAVWDERVQILKEDGDRAFIRYNITGGTKEGWVNTSGLTKDVINIPTPPTLQTDYKTLSENLQAQLNNKVNEIDILSKDKANLNSIIAQRDNDILNLKSQIGDLQNKNKDLNISLVSKDLNIEKLTKDIKEQSDIISKITEELNDCKNTITSSKSIYDYTNIELINVLLERIKKFFSQK